MRHADDQNPTCDDFHKAATLYVRECRTIVLIPSAYPQVEVDGDELPDGVLQVAIAAAPITCLACRTGGWLAAGTADGEVSLVSLLSCIGQRHICRADACTVAVASWLSHVAQVVMWKLQRDASDSADFHMAATMSQEQQPALHTLLRAPGPISGLAWQDPTCGSSSVLVVGHSNNTGLRLFLVQDPDGGQAQPQQVRTVCRHLGLHAVVHKE